jgi:hypothetical protein
MMTAFSFLEKRQWQTWQTTETIPGKAVMPAAAIA